MKLFIFLSLIFLLPFMSIAQTKELPQLGKNSTKEVIAAMTLEEKANLVVGAGMRFGAPPQRDSIARRDSANRQGYAFLPLEIKTVQDHIMLLHFL